MSHRWTGCSTPAPRAAVGGRIVTNTFIVKHDLLALIALAGTTTAGRVEMDEAGTRKHTHNALVPTHTFAKYI